MVKPLKRLSLAGALALSIVANSWAAQTWTVNFKDSDIQEVIKFVADVTGRTVVIDPRVKGRVKVISSKPLTEDELIHLFRTVLEVHDYSVVEVGEVLRIIPLKDTRSSPVPVVERASNEKGFLTQVIQLQNIAAAKVLPSIRPLVPQHSHLSAYDPSNAIIITDSAENISRIRKLIEMLDKNATPITEVIELKYANAADLAQVLESIDKQDKTKSPQNTLNLTADKRNNAILITGEDLARQRIKALIKRLDRPKSQSGNVRVRYLEYADAKKAAETLTKVMANLSKLGPGGKADAKSAAATVEADEDTNSLLITASGDELNTLLEVVDHLDIRRAQVLIEAIIAEVSASEGNQLGIEWLFTDRDSGGFGSSSKGAQGGSTLLPVGGGALQDAGAVAEGNPATALATALASTAGQVLGVIGSDDQTDFSVVLKALQSNGKTNILSTPSLLTMDNHEASFIVGDNIPILTGSSAAAGNAGISNPFQTFNRQDVGIKLTVTPQVNEGNTILLDIEQEVSGIKDTGSVASGTTTTTQRKIQTQILSADGEVVVLGGLIETRTILGEDRVPVLGKIPLLGRLFRSNSKTLEKTNLMVFLKVSVLRDEETLAGATAQKYNYIRDQQLKQQHQGFLRFKEKDLSVVPDFSFYRNGPVPDDVIKTPGAAAAEKDED